MPAPFQSCHLLLSFSHKLRFSWLLVWQVICLSFGHSEIWNSDVIWIFYYSRTSLMTFPIRKWYTTSLPPSEVEVQASCHWDHLVGGVRSVPSLPSSGSPPTAPPAGRVSAASTVSPGRSSGYSLLPADSTGQGSHHHRLGRRPSASLGLLCKCRLEGLGCSIADWQRGESKCPLWPSLVGPSMALQRFLWWVVAAEPLLSKRCLSR